MHLLKNRTLIWQLIVVVAVSMLCFPGAHGKLFPAFDRLEYQLRDLKFRLRGPLKPSGNIAVVAIDDASLKELGQWPLRRDVTALIIDRIFALGAENVGVDILFPDKNVEQAKPNAILAAVLKKYSGRIALARTNDLVPIPEFVEAAGAVGFVSVLKQWDGLVREVQFRTVMDQEKVLSLPLVVVATRLRRDPALVIQQDQGAINYLGPRETLPYFSAIDLLNQDPQSFTPETLPLKGKSILFGVSATAAYDQIATPFGAVVDGVEVQANVAEQLLANKTPRERGQSVWLSILGLSFCVLVLVNRQKTAWAVVTLCFCCGAYAVIDFIAFKNNIFAPTLSFYLNMLVIALTTFGSRFYETNQQKKFLKNAFSKYLAPDVVKLLLAQPEALTLGGERREITTLFCDLRNFTSISERLEPSQLTQLLNEVFTVLTEVIFKYQGTVDKYIGDALMAFFGAPLEQPDHALRACLAAQEMVREIRKQQAHFKTKYGVDLNLGVGINTGIAHVGNMGSEQRFNYSVLGDSVNIASRVESCTKEYGATILTTQATLNAISQNDRGKISHRSVAQVQLKGKSSSIELFEIAEI